MNRKSFQTYLAALIILNIILSGYITLGSYTNNELCIAGGNCHLVQNSAYSEVLGIKVSLLGTLAFTALLILYLASIKNRKIYPHYLTLVTLGAIVALYFIFIQAFILKQFCSSCLVVDSLTILIAALSIYEFKKYKKSAVRSVVGS